MRGLLLLDKAEGKTSFDALKPLKGALGTGKIGHSGTLDRFASGLLAVLVGPYTRLTPFFEGLDKDYRAAFRFGAETDTLDPEGRVIAEGPLPSEQAILQALPLFVGPQLQRPPEFSAIHVGGKRAYERKLKGEDFELPPRPITIHSIDFIGYADGLLEVAVRCSKGTYVRSLARDIALSIGSRAHVEGLRRERVGPFSVADAFVDGRGVESARPREMSMEEAGAMGLGTAALTGEGYLDALSGRQLGPSSFEEGALRSSATALFRDGRLVAVASLEGGATRYACVLGSGD